MQRKVLWFLEVFYLAIFVLTCTDLLGLKEGHTLAFIASNAATQAASTTTTTNPPNAMTTNVGVAAWLYKLLEPEVAVPLSIAIVSGFLWSTRKSEIERKELGRLQFLEVVGSRIEDILDKRVTPQLENLDERVTVIAKHVQDQQVRSETLDLMYKAVNDRVISLEVSLAKHFDFVEEQLGEVLYELPCIHRGKGSAKGIKFLKVKPCREIPNATDESDALY